MQERSGTNLMQSKAHWENVYRTKDATNVSWFQQHPKLSLQFIESTGLDKTAQIIDVGGGASTLVDELLANGYQNITVLDISAVALQVARQRLGRAASAVTWLEADVKQSNLPDFFYDVWHDRAVFHFLIMAEDRARYLDAMRRSVKEGGHIIVATFALEGPLFCSGLEVVGYDADSLQNEFGEDFELIETTDESHLTPFGSEQKFVYCHFRKTS